MQHVSLVYNPTTVPQFLLLLTSWFACSGTELVTNPTLVFCDEPSSGLDAYNAQQTINSLLTLARAGRTVICTLHQVDSCVHAGKCEVGLTCMLQPRSEIFGMMDQVNCASHLGSLP